MMGQGKVLCGIGHPRHNGCPLILKDTASCFMQDSIVFHENWTHLANPDIGIRCVAVIGPIQCIFQLTTFQGRPPFCSS